MKLLLAISICGVALPALAQAATRTYDVAAFDAVSVSAGIDADITMGPTRSVVADTKADNFDDLQISVEGKVLKIGRPAGSWFSGRRPDYHVHVVTPALHSLTTSSGANTKVAGNVDGDLTVEASSGSDLHIAQIKGGNVRSHSSSGADIRIAGSCQSLDAGASSGSDLDAEDLQCEKAAVQLSSGSHMSVTATQSVTGGASSGSDLRVRGKPGIVQVEKSSGARVVMKD